ncbi:hypothetical protein [Pseudorhodobacter ferrugineus]|uniref:hypothetical protein n=1 Tax=Pseudorhodobacter ferrugineus TaxID=77008 RepID=UPI0004117FC9
MCGRILMTHPNEAMAGVFKAVPDNDLPEVPRYNICPTRPVAVVTGNADGGRRLRARRSIVPATGFYECLTGEGCTRLPWLMTRTDGLCRCLAGIGTRLPAPDHLRDGHDRVGAWRSPFDGGGKSRGVAGAARGTNGQFQSRARAGID